MAADSQTYTAPIAEIPLSPDFGWGWTIALIASAALAALLVYTALGITFIGIGLWGTNIPHVWGFDLTNYAWWIGVANGSSLFAAILVLRRHSLRTAINRFAEGLALFSVICAGLFPILHLGRPWLFYWMIPYPAEFLVWPQFRSPLVWDFWAILTHIVVTSLFWYVGLIPDLATMRDRARRARTKRTFAIAALGWRGSGRHWAYHQRAYRLVAATVLPLLLVMQTVVAFEFAATLVPDWHETRQPLHFVVSGVETGLAFVVIAATILRRALRLERYIDDRDIDLLGKLLLSNAIVVGYVYAGELLTTFLADSETRRATINRFTGDYLALYWGAILLAVVIPQALWIKRLRMNPVAGVIIGLSVITGVWLDRLSIVVGGIEVGFLPSMRRSYSPTGEEWLLLIGTAGLFVALMLLFVRFLPVISMFETRHAEREEKTP